VTKHALDAVERSTTAAAQIPSGRVVGCGIDCPIYWTPTADRNADDLVRRCVRSAGSKTAGGTVQRINSLRGACVVQGIIAGLILRTGKWDIPLSESHPKALLHLLEPGSKPALVVKSLIEFSQAAVGEDERDAALSALSAWAMIVHPSGWSDLLKLENSEILFPLQPPIGYWMPIEA
jgi:hypothetical protein